jgi:hypothetical protein
LLLQMLIGLCGAELISPNLSDSVYTAQLPHPVALTSLLQMLIGLCGAELISPNLSDSALTKLICSVLAAADVDWSVWR